MTQEIHHITEAYVIFRLLKSFCSRYNIDDPKIYEHAIKYAPQSAIMQHNLGNEIGLFYSVDEKFGQTTGVLLYVIFPKYLFLSRIIVNQGKKGIGGILFKNLLKEAKRLNKSNIKWKVVTDNKNALSFYKSLGYESNETVKGKNGMMYVFWVEVGDKNAKI